MSTATNIRVRKFDIVQVLHKDQWLDYATIKDRDDVSGLNRLQWDRSTFRVVNGRRELIAAVTKGVFFELVEEV